MKKSQKTYPKSDTSFFIKLKKHKGIDEIANALFYKHLCLYN